MAQFPAIGLLEVSSIAKGLLLTDAVVKKASVSLLRSCAVSPGRYLTMFWGEVAEVDESLREGLSLCGDKLVNSFFLPGADRQVIQVLTGELAKPPIDSLGIFETFDVSSSIVSADAACKAAEVQLVEMRLANGIHGKGYWIISGLLHDIEAAMDAATAAAGENLVHKETIARPHEDMLGFLWNR